MSCNEDDLLALSRGELSTARAREVERHSHACETCRAELAWLRAERTLIARRAERAPAPPPAQWAAIADRIAIASGQKPGGAPAPRRASRRGWIVAAGAGALVAAAATLLFVLPRAGDGSFERAATSTIAVDAGTSEDRPEPTRVDEDRARRRLVRIAIQRAEDEYTRAIDVLDGEYQEQRASLPEDVARVRDAEMRRLRAELDAIRSGPGDDVDYRLRVLQASAVYVRSMQKLVLQEETP
jgi:hypothetical protein